MSARSFHRATAVKGALLLAGVALTAAACGGSSGGSSALKAAGSAAKTSGVTIATRHSSLGTYLTDSSGRTLYVFAADSMNKSNCSGSCATYWPPLTSTSSAKAMTGVTQSMLGTTKRSDGKTQITYAGHPLYYYVGDGKSGAMKGQGLNLSGGLWWIVGPSGKAITSKSGNSSGGYGGGGYGGG